MRQQPVGAVVVMIVALVGLALPEESAGQIPEAVRKEALARHADAVPLMITAKVKNDGKVFDEMFIFGSKSADKQIWVGTNPAGKLEAVVMDVPGVMPPLPAKFQPLKDALAEARKKGLAGGYKGPLIEEPQIWASLTIDSGAPLWRFQGVDAAGMFVSIAIGGSDGPPPDPVLSDIRIPATAENIPRVLKHRVGPDAANVAVRVQQPETYSMILTLAGRVTHPGVKMQIRRAIVRFTDVPGNLTYDDSAVVAPGRPALLGAYNPSGDEMTTAGRLQFSQDGRRLAIFKGADLNRGMPERIDVLDLPARRVALSAPAPFLGRSVYVGLPQIAMAPDGAGGAAVVKGGERTAVMFFGDAAGVKPAALKQEHNLISLAVAPAGKAAAISLWEPGTAGLVHLVKEGVLTELPVEPALGIDRTLLAFSPDGRQLAVGERNGKFVTVWDVATAKEVHRVARENLFNTALAWSSDGHRLAIGSHEGILIAEIGSAEPRVLEGMPGSAQCLAWSPDGTRLASMHDVGVGLWDIASGKLINALETQAAGENIVAFADNGKTLLTGIVRASGELRRWNVGGSAATDNPIPVGGTTAITGVGQKIDRAGDLLLSIEYRIAGVPGQDCLLMVNFRDAAGRPIVATNPARRGPNGELVLAATIRAEGDPENAYRVLRLPRAEVPAGAVTVEIRLSAGGRSLLEVPHTLKFNPS